MNTPALEAELKRIATERLVNVPAQLSESVLYSLLGPGKRIRPRLVASVGKSLGLSEPITHRIAAALEMIHAYTLVHDDLPAMDNDDTRRGRPTNHKVYGEAVAILAGDSLALLGPDTLLGLRTVLPAERVLALLEVLLEAAGARGVISGQAAELALESNRPEKVETLFEIFRLKTGALFRAALTMPAIAADAPAETISSLKVWGDSLGIVFQIADDLEDDFTEKKSNPAHIAAYLGFSRAHAEALTRLRAMPSLPPSLQSALAPYLAELEQKLKSVTEAKR